MAGRSNLQASPAPPERATYRHGDLRRALLDAGMALARAGGPDAVVLREATRRAGVVPNAAYRHFAGRDELLQAVRAAALAALARAMEAEMGPGAIGRSGPSARPDTRRTLRATRATRAEAARAALRAVGTGYLRFAQKEPGLFRTAFAGSLAVESDHDPGKAGASGLNPFQLLGRALDDLVDAGVLPIDRRPGAEYLAWSTVHGLALLVIDGPLRTRSRRLLDALGQRLLDMVERGL